MVYRQDLITAARRHLRAATELHAAASAGAQPGCRSVAGYLFGLTGELAVKALMRSSGMAPLAPESRRDDPYYAHFPELKARLGETAFGRREGELRKIAESQTLFQHWNTQMRYAPTEDIREAWIVAWRSDAEALIGKMELP